MSDGFNSIWLQLQTMCQQKMHANVPFHTLVDQARHYVEEVNDTGILVKTESTNKKCYLRRSEFNRGWKQLNTAGKNGIRLRGINWIVKAILSQLPNVEYKICKHNKRIWFLMPNNTHPIGTTKVHP